jgi:hypothetical protein
VRNIRLIIFLSILSFSGLAFAEGLKTLIEVGKNMAEAEKVSAQETKNFGKIKSAIKSGALKSGLPRDKISKDYGDPVVRFDKDDKMNETWIYKPAASSYFEGEKIYLVFDIEGKLESTKMMNQK